MKLSSQFLLLFFFVAIPKIIFGFGLTDWSNNTPNGNEISYNSYTVLYLKNNTELEDLVEWYFYKNHIIGVLQNDNSGEITGYFVVNELTFQITQFRVESEWSAFLAQNRLIPKMWTRWYDWDWTFLDAKLFILFYFAFFLVVPLLIIFLVVLFKAIVKEGFNLRKPYTIIVVIILSMVFIRLLLEKFPSSI